jgi:hypothetical protein
MFQFLALSSVELTAIGTVIVSGVSVAIGTWKFAETQSRSRAVDTSKLEETLRKELRQENKELRQENHVQYEVIKGLKTERDLLEDALIDAHRYIDEVWRCIMERKEPPPKPPLPVQITRQPVRSA